MKLTICIVLLLTYFGGHCQSNTPTFTVKKEDNVGANMMVFDKDVQLPSLPKNLIKQSTTHIPYGISDLYYDIIKNTKWLTPDMDKLETVFFLGLTIDSVGNTTQFSVIKHNFPDALYEQLTTQLDVLKQNLENAPTVIPGSQNGREVSIEYTLPVRFSMLK